MKPMKYIITLTIIIMFLLPLGLLILTVFSGHGMSTEWNTSHNMMNQFNMFSMGWMMPVFWIFILIGLIFSISWILYLIQAESVEPTGNRNVIENKAEQFSNEKSEKQGSQEKQQMLST